MTEIRNGSIEQLHFFGASNTQQHFHSERWGMLDFISDASADRCKHCLLKRDEEECRRAPCCPLEREDGKTGFFSVRMMPQF